MGKAGNPGLSDEECQQAAELYRQFGNQEKAADSIGISRSAFQNRLRHAARRGFLGTGHVLPGFEISRTTTTPNGAQFVQQKPARDRAPFAMPTGHELKGVSALLDGDGDVVQAWYKTKEGEPDRSVFIEELKAALSELDGVATIAPPPDADDDLLTVYVLPDLHLGMLAWGKESGEDYDLKIASEMVRREIGRLVTMSPPSRHAAIIFLGDLFHQNDQTNVTPRSGHQLDVDGRWRRVYGVGARLARDVTNSVAECHKEIEIAILPGNHDQDAAVTLAVAFELFYSGHDRITVAGHPGEHWFKRFGKCLIGANHGHRMKPDRMAMLLATDRPEDWGATTFRHFFFGHVHHERALEVGPVRVESFSSPAAKDAYAAASGYRSGRALNAITFHRERGEICRHRVNISTETDR